MPGALLAVGSLMLAMPSVSVAVPRAGKHKTKDFCLAREIRCPRVQKQKKNVLES